MSEMTEAMRKELSLQRATAILREMTGEPDMPLYELTMAIREEFRGIVEDILPALKDLVEHMDQLEFNPETLALKSIGDVAHSKRAVELTHSLGQHMQLFCSGVELVALTMIIDRIQAMEVDDGGAEE